MAKTIYPGGILPPPFVPYDYQIPIIKKMIEAILKGKNGLVVQPTATGKSIVASFVARSCILIHKMRGIYLYDENEGLDQARKRFELVLGKNEVKCANFFGYGKEYSVTEADMVFASFQSLNNHHEKWYKLFDPEHFGFMIVNEAHHGQAITYKEVIDYFSCSKIGMTATPERMDEKNILDIFDSVLWEITLEEAIAKNMIANIEYHIHSHGLSTLKLKDLCAEILEEGKRISIKQLNETIFIQDFDEAVFEEIFKYSFPENDDPRQTMIFCENIMHAERVFTFLSKNGKNAQILHSKKSTSHNREAMKKFRQNETQFLVSVDKLNEDIDVPNVEVAVFLRATDSLTVFLQQLGRGLRKTSKKRKAIILDFVANAERLIFLSNLIEKTMRISKILAGSDRLPLDRNLLEISGEGFEFTLTDDLVQILDLIKALKEGYFKTWQEASKVVMEAGIKSWEEYRERYRTISLRLHSNPHMIYPDFPGWKIFLGTKYQTWQEAGEASAKLGAKSAQDYERIRNRRYTGRDSKFPKNPDTFYPDFPGWKNFLGFKNPPKGWIRLKNDAGVPFSYYVERRLRSEKIKICYFWQNGKAVEYVLYSDALPFIEENNRYARKQEWEK
jgi:superfamily II DNA or RNA helicase